MDKTAKLLSLVNGLQRAIAALFNITEKDVSIDVYIFHSDEAYKGAAKGKWTPGKKDEVEWLRNGEYIRGICITIYPDSRVKEGGK